MPLRRAQARSQGTMPLGTGNSIFSSFGASNVDRHAVAQGARQFQSVLRENSDLVAAEHVRREIGEGLFVDRKCRVDRLALRQIQRLKSLSIMVRPLARLTIRKVPMKRALGPEPIR